MFREIRCVVCQNESIDDSEADLARDLRAAAREQVAAGRSDAEVRGFMVERYGEFVLLKPRLSRGTRLLWFATPAVLAAAMVLIFLGYRRRRAASEALAPLSAGEKRRLDRLLDGR